VGAGGLKPPYPRNSIERRGKEERKEEERICCCSSIQGA